MTCKPMAGELYVLPPGHPSVDLEWLLLRTEWPDEDHVTAVPTDSFTLVGTPDVDLSGYADRPLIARCGYACFFPIKRFAAYRPTHLTQVLPDTALKLARGVVADLARGRFTSDSDQRTTDADPEYEHHQKLVEEAIELFQARHF